MPRQRKTEAIWLESQKRWRVRVYVNGKEHAFYSSIPKRKGKIEAERAADDWLDAGCGDNPRFETLWADFIVEIKRTTGSENHRHRERTGRLYFLPTLKLKRIASITPQDWQDCITAAYEKGLSKKTCLGIRGTVTTFYNYARKRRIQMECPEFLIVPRDAPAGTRNILQPDQLKTLFAVDHYTAHGKEKPCFFIHAWRFIVLTGLRRGELCGLRREDLNGLVLHISRSINSLQEETSGKTENAQRYIALSQRLVDTLTAQENMLKDRGIISPWLFPDESGDRLNGNHLYRMWYTYRAQHGIESSIHELRHTMISLVKSDVPDALLKPRVGHSAAMDTGAYQHEVDGEAERAAQLIDDVFTRILEPEKTGSKTGSKKKKAVKIVR